MIRHLHRLKPGDTVTLYTSKVVHAFHRSTTSGNVVTMCGQEFRPGALSTAYKNGPCCKSCGEMMEIRRMLEDGGPQ